MKWAEPVDKMSDLMPSDTPSKQIAADRTLKRTMGNLR